MVVTKKRKAELYAEAVKQGNKNKAIYWALSLARDYAYKENDHAGRADAICLTNDITY